MSVLLSTCEGMSNRADAEAEKSVKRALIDERARWILQEVTAEFLMIAAEAILTETAFHRLEGYASDSDSFVMHGWCDDKLVEADYTQAFLNVEVQEEKQLDFLESMQVYKKVYAEWSQASDWREAWNRIWNQRAERTSVV